MVNEADTPTDEWPELLSNCGPASAFVPEERKGQCIH